MADGHDKPEGPIDEFVTLAPSAPLRSPAAASTPQAMETIVQASPSQGTNSPASPRDTPPGDVYATLAREIPAGATVSSLPPSGTPIAGLPFDRVGEYDILDKIGHGGMGLVLKARHRRLKRTVALKLIKVGQLAEEQEVARFLVEARAAAHLKHPNIVAVYDVGEHAGSPFFTMEYVEGQSLHKLISERPLQPQRAATIIRKLALAVGYAHESGILHRDLKPQNILLDKYEEPKITDFGLATNAQENSQLTATGTVLGTPSYMPPEQARGKHEEMGKWSDVYSLGATFYETLVGRPPFTAATLGETLQQVMTVDPVSPRSLNPAIPRDLETICLKCLEKNPARRYQTGQELADELQRFLDDRPILARPTSRTEKFVRWCRRNPVIAGAIAAVSLAAVFAIVSLWIGLSQALAAKEEANDALNHSMDIVEDLLVGINEETLLEQPGMQPIKAKIYAKAQTSLEKLLPKLERSKRLPETIARVQLQMGQVKVQLGDHKEGLRLMTVANESLEKMHENDATNVKVLTNLSKVKTEIGRLYFNQRDLKAASAPILQSLELRRKLVELEPDNTEAAQLLANSEMNVGLLEENLGNPQKALEQYEAAQWRRKALLTKEPANVGILRDQAKGLSELGLLRARQQKLREAEELFEQAEKAFTSLTDRRDRQLDDLLNHGIVLRRLGDMAAVTNDEKKLNIAIERYVKSVKLLEELVTENPSVGIYRGTLAAARLNLAQLNQRQRNSREAFALLTQAFDDFNRLKANDVSYKKHEMKTFHELLRLRKWNKLGAEQQQDLTTWIDVATTANGEAWVKAIEKLASSSSEFPNKLSLEETDLFSPQTKPASDR
jgi:eukaryotic-like serine/threonine-protein kinase